MPTTLAALDKSIRSSSNFGNTVLDFKETNMEGGQYRAGRARDPVGFVVFTMNKNLYSRSRFLTVPDKYSSQIKDTVVAYLFEAVGSCAREFATGRRRCIPENYNEKCYGQNVR